MKNSECLKVINLLIVALVVLAGCSQERGDDSNLVQADAYLDTADVYRLQGQFRSAMIETQNALQISPGNQRALILAAQVGIDLGDNDQALEILNGLNQQYPGDGEIILLLAEALLNSGNHLETLALLESIQMQEPQQQQKLNWLRGAAFAANGDQQLSKDAFQTILNDDSDNVDALIALSKLEYQEGNLESSDAYMEQAIAANPENLDLWIWRGVFATLQEQYPQAESAFFEALQIMGSYDTMTPKRFSVLQDILIPLQMQQKNDEALRYSQIIAASPQGQFQNNYRSAVEFFQQRDYEQAEQALSNALVIAPNHPDSNILMGLAQYEQGDYASAELSLSNFVNLVSSSPTPVKTLAATHIQLNQPERALAILNEARIEFPEDPSIVAMIGLSQQLMGDVEESIASLNQALAIQPDSADIYFTLARSQFLMDDVTASIASLEQASSLNPEFAQAKSTLIGLYLNQGNIDTAKNLVQSWIDNYPASALNSNLAGQIAFGEGNYSQARVYFNSSLSLDSTDIQSRIYLTNIAVGEEDFGQAEELIGQIKQLLPNSVFGNEIEGDYFQARSDFESATTSYQRAWEIGKTPSTGVKLHSSLRALGRNTEAVALLNSWIEDQPENGAANYLLALDHQDGGRDAEAIRSYEIAIKQLPDNFVLLNNLAWLYPDSVPERALELAERAVELVPSNPEVLDTYGWILIKQNDKPKAIEVLRRALELAPDSESISEHLNAALQ